MNDGGVSIARGGRRSRGGDGGSVGSRMRGEGAGDAADRDDLPPAFGGEMKFVKVVDAILAVVTAEDVHGIAEYGRGVEGSLAGGTAGRERVGGNDGPSFILGGGGVGRAVEGGGNAVGGARSLIGPLKMILLVQGMALEALLSLVLHELRRRG